MTGTQNNPGAWYAEFVALLDHEAWMLGELDSLSRGQRAMVERDDGEGLLAAMGERETLLAELTRAATTVDRMRGEWPQFEAALTHQQTADLRMRLAAVTTLTDGIARRDREDGAAMRTRRDALAGELAGLTTGKRAVGAYGTAAAAPRFQDTHG